jgi:putative oxidoreductase
LGFGFIPAAWSPYLLSVLRIVAALEFLQHGTAKYLKFPTVKMYENFNPVSPVGVAGFFELIGSLFLLVGLFSRFWAFFMSGVMPSVTSWPTRLGASTRS